MIFFFYSIRGSRLFEMCHEYVMICKKKNDEAYFRERKANNDSKMIFLFAGKSFPNIRISLTAKSFSTYIIKMRWLQNLRSLIFELQHLPIYAYKFTYMKRLLVKATYVRPKIYRITMFVIRYRGG